MSNRRKLKIKRSKLRNFEIPPLRLRSGLKGLYAKNDIRMYPNAKKTCRSRSQGAALLVVLFVVMAITILSLGFLSRSDVELACGGNMILRTQMDYFAESGLEHAKGLILNPQDIDSEYWAGDVRQQLVAGSGDYYDVNVVKIGECNYQITCDAYREKNGEKIGRSGLEAELRLDPCIAYWAGTSTTILQRITINGDVYCDGALSNNGYINGDVFASGTISGANIEGHINQTFDGTPVSWPGLDINDFSSNYYIDSASYSVEVIGPDISNSSFVPSEGNPAGIHYCNDPNNLVNLGGNATINGTLVVDGDLTISGTNNVIIAVKNFPALLVSGKVIMADGGTLEIKGLAQIAGGIVISGGSQNVGIDVIGGLFIANGNIGGLSSSLNSINITAAPSIASIQIWPEPGIAQRWSPAAGAFFRSIRRN